jgi:hypothetical protein
MARPDVLFAPALIANPKTYKKQAIKKAKSEDFAF